MASSIVETLTKLSIVLRVISSEMKTTATVLSACTVLERCLFACAFKCPQRKNQQVLNRVTLGARRCLLAKREDAQKASPSKVLENAAKCEL
ncbi:hypothetical protein Trydic_g6416 [Trypoxylus dichotomus]